jgi:hypothetical protein
MSNMKRHCWSQQNIAEFLLLCGSGHTDIPLSLKNLEKIISKYDRRKRQSKALNSKR